MSKTAKIGIIAGVVVIFVLLMYFFVFKGKDEGYITDNWRKTYAPDDRGPYGTYMLKELLDTTGLFGNFLELDEKLETQLEDDPEINDIYFFVGRKNYLSDSATNHLMDFIAEGNSAVISAEVFPQEMLDLICYDRDEFFEDTTVIDSTQHFKFMHPNFKGKRYSFDYINHNRLKLTSWFYFNQDNFSLFYGDTLIPLGANTKDQWNFIKIKYGDGQLFLHSLPYQFTNIMMMRRDGYQYAENVLRHIPPGRIQWDRYNLTFHSKQNKNRGNGGGGDKRRSILQFIVNNPPLFWAFLILLGGAILYALFKGKRMQKIIPAAASKDNMSLQYINTLSSLYLQEKKHNKLIKLKEKTFMNFIAEHYYIHSHKIDDKFVDKLAVKSQVPKEHIIAIFQSFNELENSVDVSDHALIELHKKIEHFYKTCR